MPSPSFLLDLLSNSSLHPAGPQACITDYYYNSYEEDHDGCILCNKDEAICVEHTTIASIVVLKGYYRFTRSDPTIYPCPRERLCLQSSNTTDSNATDSNTTDSTAFNCWCVISRYDKPRVVKLTSVF